MKPPFPYFGSKAGLAPTIVGLMPRHTVYLEPYAGSAAVFLAKPRSEHEILNDANAAIVTFFRMLRDRPDELEEACRLTPYARDEYLLANLNEPGLDDLELARRWWIRSNAAVGGIVENRTTFSASSKLGASRAKTAKRRLDRLHLVADRLADAIVDNRDAVDAIRHFADRSDAVIYADPPYLATTRTGPGGYHVDRPEETHHRELAKALHETDAFVILSGYPSPLYEELFADWHQIEKATSANFGTTDRDRTEVLWTNQNPHHGKLFP